MKDYIYVGKVVGTHGIKGEIRIVSDSEIKDQVFVANKNIYIGEHFENFTIRTYRHHKIYDMVTLNDIDDINEVIRLKGKKVYIKRDDIIINDYLLEDLIGMKVLEDNIILGKVIDVIKNGSNILLQISGEKNFYIPKVNEYIISVDLDKKVITTKNTKGLIL